MYFLKKCCNQKDYVIEGKFSKLAWPNIFKENEEYEKWINEGYEAINHKMMEVLRSPFHLPEHFESLRKYLLLGQGDFIQALIDNLAGELSKNADQIYPHTIESLLETAVRSSNCQFHSAEYIKCLTTKLLQKSPGDLGWDIFSLDYNIQPPLSTIITKETKKEYMRIFNYLWRIKRIEYNLSNIWLDQIEFKKALKVLQENKADFQKANIIRHQMMLLVSSLNNYLMVEVIESYWKVFTDAIKLSKSLDEIIKHHDQLIQNLLNHSLLSNKYKSIQSILLKIFEIINRYRTTQEIFFTTAINEYKRRLALQMQNKQNAGQSTVELLKESTVSTEARKDLDSIYNSYKKSTELLFKELMKSVIVSLRKTKN